MNGIIALARLAGPPLDVEALRRPLAALSHRSPRPAWALADGVAALGGCEGAPNESAGAILVTADARLDVSASLRSELGLSANSSAADVIARAQKRRRRRGSHNA